jgi:NAD(P)-dependent dehydrogenase (short-subunit alcohol dehydrogenase family)
MADWRTLFEIDLVGSARLLDALFPLVTTDTAAVCFASMAPHLAAGYRDAAVEGVLDEPLAGDFLDRLAQVAGPSIEDAGLAYMWAKRGVLRLVQREAVRWGPRGGRVCSISPGMIDTPQGRQEAEAQPVMTEMLGRTPLGRFGRAGELADVVAFMLSHTASFLTGVDVLVDGGVVAAMTTTPPGGA